MDQESVEEDLSCRCHFFRKVKYDHLDEWKMRQDVPLVFGHKSQQRLAKKQEDWSDIHKDGFLTVQRFRRF